MIASLLLGMAAATAQADSAAQRRALTACFRTVATKALEEKKAPGDFEGLARAQCAAEINAFRSAVVAVDVRAGRARQAAQSDADLQIADYLTSFAERLEPAS